VVAVFPRDSNEVARLRLPALVKKQGRGSVEVTWASEGERRCGKVAEGGTSALLRRQGGVVEKAMGGGVGSGMGAHHGEEREVGKGALAPTGIGLARASGVAARPARSTGKPRWLTRGPDYCARFLRPVQTELKRIKLNFKSFQTLTDPNMTSLSSKNLK
jgi:hypothetical protein